MKFYLCLLVVLATSSRVNAQEPIKPRWALGAELGYAGMYSQLIDDLPVLLDANASRITGDPRIGDSGGEGAFGVHVGKSLSGFLRADALLSLTLIGVMGNESGHLFSPNSGGTYTTAQYDEGTGVGFITTGMRFIAERTRMRSAFRPRATVSAVWQWTKGPAAIMTAGFSTGSSATRFTVDAGEQFTWLRYDRAFRTYQTSNNALMAEERLQGTKRLRGFSVRLGVDHYVF